MSTKGSYVVVRDQCPDEPRIVRNVTHEELLRELEHYRDCGDTSWEVFSLGEPTQYRLEPARIVQLPGYRPPQAITS